MNEWNPGMWSRVDWVKDPSDRFWYCTTHYAAEDEAAALLEHEEHDHELYETTGCGGFSFSLLSETGGELSLAGQYEDSWGTKILFSDDFFVSTYDGGQPTIVEITHIDDAEGFVVGQNSMSNSFDPGMWSRLDWLEDAGGTLWYCT